MSRRIMVVGAVLALLAITVFATWPMWKWLYIKRASAALHERTKALVEKNPQLKPDWDKAMEDGVLTWAEAKDIVEKGGEKVEPEQ